MIELKFPLNDFIRVQNNPSRDTNWPTPSPFTLSFHKKALNPEHLAAISGSGIYLISSNEEVVYIGSYKPTNGNIIADRWGRHLQTITGRGYNIGLGGKSSPEARRQKLIQSITADTLQEAVRNAHDHSCAERFKDTGYSTTPNRLRFASENWITFETAEDEKILQPLTFTLLRIKTPATQTEADHKVIEIERLLLQKHIPICNKEYNHIKHNQFRQHNTTDAITATLRSCAIKITGEDITHCTHLIGKLL